MLPLLALLFAAASVTWASADDLQIARGRTFARVNCGQCHAIGPQGESPMADAPPFRDLQKRYPVDDLARPLTEGILTGHPSMPAFRLYRDQVNDLIAYINTVAL
jgi:mono/diheme cytochrome c family protein